jgi:hypothetical protein
MAILGATKAVNAVIPIDAHTLLVVGQVVDERQVAVG